MASLAFSQHFISVHLQHELSLTPQTSSRPPNVQRLWIYTLWILYIRPPPPALR